MIKNSEGQKNPHPLKNQGGQGILHPFTKNLDMAGQSVSFKKNQGRQGNPQPFMKKSIMVGNLLCLKIKEGREKSASFSRYIK